MKTLRVLIADDHEIVRHGVRKMLETQVDVEVCGESANGREAVAEAARLKPHLVVMDIAMPEMNGLEATRQILKDNPAVEVLILTMHESEELVRNVLAAGARGYVLKSDVTDSLISAVRALARHQVFISSKVAEVVLQGYLSHRAEPGAQAGLPVEISPREREIVQLVAEGRSNKDVAEVLHISVKTVETHRSHIMSKLDLHSVSDLVRYAIRNHIIET
jgi:DNA-binding NarL/FixJ family response regulator